MENLGETLMAVLPPGDVEAHEYSTIDNKELVDNVCALSTDVPEAFDKGKCKKSQNLSKADRKNARKSSKMMQVVSRQVGVKISEEPNDVSAKHFNMNDFISFHVYSFHKYLHHVAFFYCSA